MILQGKKLEEYMENTEFFKLIDFSKTNDKYKNYKVEKFNTFLEDENRYYSVEQFEDELFSYQFNHHSRPEQLAGQEPSKSNIRALATHINYIMRNDIEAEIRWRDDTLNNNEVKCFTIKYYLHFYKEINEAMTNILKTYVLPN